MAAKKKTKPTISEDRTDERQAARDKVAEYFVKQRPRDNGDFQG